CGRTLKNLFVKNILFVFAAESAESRLRLLANRPQMTRHTRRAVGMLPFPLLANCEAGDRGCLKEEAFNHLGNQAALARLGRLADDGGKVEFALGKSFERRIGDAPEMINIHLLDDALLNQVLCHLISRVHIAQHLFELVARENLSKNIEDLPRALGIESFLDLFNALKELSEDSAFAGVGRNEVEDEAVFFLAVAVDASHALFQANRVP